MSMTVERPDLVPPSAQSQTLEKPPSASVARPESSRPAWVAVLLAPFVAAGALVVGFALEAWWGADVIMLALAAVPILGGFVLGFRSARTVNGSAPWRLRRQPRRPYSSRCF